MAPDYQAFESRNLGRLRQALRQVAATELARYDPRLAARFDPSDLVQDAFLRACRAIGTWRGETDDELFAWLHSILSNHLANEVRACLTLRRDVRREVHALPTVEGRGDPGGVELSDPQARRPETRLEADEALAILARGLSALEDDQRRAFLLRHVEGLSLPEIAARLLRSRASAAGLIRRALLSLRESVREEAADRRQD